MFLLLQVGIVHDSGYGDNFQAVLPVCCNAIQEMERFVLNAKHPIQRDIKFSARAETVSVGNSPFSVLARNRTYLRHDDRGKG